MLKDLPLRDRAWHVRRQGSVMTVDLEALMQVKERKTSVDATAAGRSMRPPSGRPKATRVYLHNRLLRRDRERKNCERVRERQYVTSLLDTMVSPSNGCMEFVSRSYNQCFVGLEVRWIEKHKHYRGRSQYTV